MKTIKKKFWTTAVLAFAVLMGLFAFSACSKKSKENATPPKEETVTAESAYALVLDYYKIPKYTSDVTVVDEKGEKAVATVIVTKKIMNYTYPKVYFKGLVPEYTYKVSFRKQAEFDDAVEFVATGSALMSMGVYVGNMFTDKAVAENFNSVQTRMVTFEKI